MREFDLSADFFSLAINEFINNLLRKVARAYSFPTLDTIFISMYSMLHKRYDSSAPSITYERRELLDAVRPWPNESLGAISHRVVLSLKWFPFHNTFCTRPARARIVCCCCAVPSSLFELMFYDSLHTILIRPLIERRALPKSRSHAINKYIATVDRDAEGEKSFVLPCNVHCELPVRWMRRTRLIFANSHTKCLDFSGSTCGDDHMCCSHTAHHLSR